MAVSVLVSKSAVSTSGAANSRSVNRSFNNKLANDTSFNSDAVVLNLSPAKLAQQRQSNRALRNLSDASSFVSIGEQATTEIARLIDQSKTVAKTIEKTVDPVRKAELAEEANSFISEIDKVVKSATVDGTRSVVNFGAQNYSFNLDGSDLSSQSKDSVFISNIAVSRSDLSLDNLNSAQFAQDPSGVVSKLDEAKNRVNFASTNLQAAQKDIDSVADKFGIRAKDRVDLVIDSDAANKIAQRISEIISEKASESSNSLDSLRVQNLISNSTNNSNQSANA